VVDLIVLACVVFAFGIVSRRLEGTILTAPIVFVLAGVVLGPAGLGLVEMGLDDHAVLLLGAKSPSRSSCSPRLQGPTSPHCDRTRHCHYASWG
jgi:hypothetical protein